VNTGLEGFSPEDATKIRLYLIKTHQTPVSLYFWYEFMADLHHDQTNADLDLSVIKAGLEAAPDDESRALLVRFSSGVLDSDDPVILERLESLIEPYRDPVKLPQTMESIRMFDVAMLLRQGKSVNLETDLTGFNESLNSHEATRKRLVAYMQAKNVTKLKDVLNTLSADDLLSSYLVRSTTPALEACGMDDEAALARSALEKQLYHDVLNAWFKASDDSLSAVEGDITALRSAANIPPAFSSFIDQHGEQQRHLLAYRLLCAYYQSNWKAAANAGAGFIQAFPTYYTMYWYYGSSLAQLGQNDAAINALSTYCRYSKDEIWYPDATALLAKLQMPSK
jgi:hypothetical protein